MKIGESVVMYFIENYDNENYVWSVVPKIDRVLVTFVKEYEEDRSSFTFYKYKIESIGKTKLPEELSDNYLVLYNEIEKMRPKDYDICPLCKSKEELLEYCESVYREKLNELFGIDLSQYKIEKI